MIGRLVVALGLGLAVSTTVLAQTPVVAPAIAPTPAPAKVDPDLEIVCKRVDVSGTRIQLPKKCMTRKDWAAIAGRGKEDIDAAIRASLTRNSVGGT
ncbi:hypothetical protein MCEMIH16_02175 [Caulobacteraceae bacterium]